MQRRWEIGREPLELPDARQFTVEQTLLLEWHCWQCDENARADKTSVHGGRGDPDWPRLLLDNRPRAGGEEQLESART